MSTQSLHWSELVATEPDLASYISQRFTAHEHHVVATTRRDGSARVSGTNLMFTNGVLWLGMMPSAARTQDLAERPSCAVHSAPINDKLPQGEGDVRLNCIARPLDQEETRSLFLAQFPDAENVMPGNFFELLVTSFSIVEVIDNEMVITSWSPRHGRKQRRYN